MSSQIAAIADAVTSAINSAGSDLSQTVVAERKYVPAFNLTDIGASLAVCVVPNNYTRELADRRSIRKEIPIDIGITKRVSQTCDPTTSAGNAELDPILQFVEEVADLFEPGELGTTGAKWARTDIPDPIYDVAMLKNERKFLSVVRVTFVIP